MPKIGKIHVQYMENTNMTRQVHYAACHTILFMTSEHGLDYGLVPSGDKSFSADPDLVPYDITGPQRINKWYWMISFDNTYVHTIPSCI